MVASLRFEDCAAKTLDESGDIPSHQIKLEGMDDEADVPHSSTPQTAKVREAAVKLDQVATTQPPRLPGPRGVTKSRRNPAFCRASGML